MVQIDVLIFDDYFKTIMNSLLTTALGSLLTFMTMRLRSYKKKRSELENLIRDNSLLTCKAIIYSENPNITLSERMKAYKMYRFQLGGNGETYLYVKNQLLNGEDPDEYVKHMEEVVHG